MRRGLAGVVHECKPAVHSSLLSKANCPDSINTQMILNRLICDERQILK